MNDSRWAALTPLTLRLDCAGANHAVVWAEGELTAVDHPDPDRERALSALGADPSPCIELVDRYARHRDDLDVLVLASRGPADPLDAEARSGVMHTGRSSSGYSSMQFVPHTRPRRAGAPRGVRGWTSYSPLNAGRGPDYDDDLSALLATGSAVAERLVATVAATWADRIVADDPRVAPARASLHAALYGRATAAARTWLGDAGAAVNVTMCGPGDAPALTRDDGTVRLALPFSWLNDVWAAGLTTVLGRFCLSVILTSSGRWTLQTVDADFGQPRPITIDAPI